MTTDQYEILLDVLKKQQAQFEIGTVKKDPKWLKSYIEAVKVMEAEWMRLVSIEVGLTSE